MSTINIKLYDLLRKDFNLSEEKTKSFAAAIEEAAKENVSSETEKYRSSFKEDILKLELKIEQSKMRVLNGCLVFGLLLFY